MSEQSTSRGPAAVAARRRAAPAKGGEGLVAIDRGAGGAGFHPVTVAAKAAGLELLDWVSGHLDLVRGMLAERGAVRLRGMTLSEESFGEVVSAVAGAPLTDYVNRSTPRDRVRGNVFTSTRYSRDHAIPMHSEQSYATSWPLVLGFWCVRPASSGGETPLAPTAAVLDALPPDLVGRFEAHGVCYERWYQPHLDLPWQEAFQTGSPAVVDQICADAGISVEWHGDAVLRTRQVSQATVVCPASGRRVWFNQASLFHIAALPEAVAAQLREAAGVRLPRNAYFGDGRPIPSSDIRAVRAAFEEVAWSQPWAAGDVVLLDNVAVAHGRQPFSGERRVLVAMAGLGGTGREAWQP